MPHSRVVVQGSTVYGPKDRQCLELRFDEVGQARPDLSLDLGEEGLGMFLYQLVKNRLLGTPLFVGGAGANWRGLNCLVRDLLHR